MKSKRPAACPRSLFRVALALIFGLSLAAGVSASAATDKRPAKSAKQRRARVTPARKAQTRETTARKSSSGKSAADKAQAAASRAAARAALASAKSVAKEQAARARAARRAEKPVLAPTAGMEEFEAGGFRSERAEWFMSRRMFPSGQLPPRARAQAWESRPRRIVKDDEQLVLPLADAFRWEPVGPAPTTPDIPNWGLTSGRINAITFHPTNPNIVLVGASTGGVWRSTDGGASFKASSDSQVDLSVGAIAFARSNPAIVYAAMGDNDNSYLGTGLLKSMDGGQTWTQVARLVGSSPGCVNGSTDGCLHSLARSTAILVDPTNPNRVYLAQYATYTGSPQGTIFASGFHVSTDGGVNWTRTLAGLVRDIVMHPTNPQIIYAGLNRKDPANTGSPGVWKSTDGGQTWNSVYTAAGPPSDIRLAVTPAAPESVYLFTNGGGLRIEVSTDGGQSWTNKGAAGIDPGQFGYNTYIAVHPANTNVIYVGTRDVFKTTNGGTSWTNMTKNFHAPSWNYNPGLSGAHPDQQSFAFVPGKPETIYVGNDGGLYKSTNGGTNFQTLNHSLALTQFVGITAHATDPNITYGGAQDNGNQRRGPGNSWQEFISGDGGRNVTVPTDPDVVFATYIRGNIWRFRGNGNFFEGNKGDAGSGEIVFGDAGAGTRDRVAFYPPFVGNKTDRALYFGTYRLWISTDLGENWTTPGGATDLTEGNSDLLSAIGLQRSGYSAAQTIYTGSAFGRVMVSTDGGATWNDRTAGLPDRAIEWIEVDRTNPAVAYLAVSGYGSSHVFKTVNHGLVWVDISGVPGAGGLPNTPANALLIDPNNPNVLYAGTDVGVFRSTTNGLNWETFNTGMPPAVISSFTVTAAGKIQVSTYGRGVYQLGESDGATLQFDRETFTASETEGGAFVVVKRSGSLSGTVTVDVRTQDSLADVGCANTSGGTAFARCDYSTTVETLVFGPGEFTKSVRVPLVDDGYAEPNENVQLSLSQPTGGAQLGAMGATTLRITSDDAAGAQNPLDGGHEFFVRQQYLDFLSREPDESGFEAWMNVLRNCPLPLNRDKNNPSNVCDRNAVSAGFFFSGELRIKGGYVFRFYRVTYGRLPDYTEIVTDMRLVTGATAQEVFQKKAAFAEAWAARPGFIGGDNSAFVNALMNRYNLQSIRTPNPATPDNDDEGAKVTLTRADLVNRLAAGQLTRGQVVRAVADSNEVGGVEAQPTAVAMQYYGYLRRTPDNDGFNAWLNHLRANPDDSYTMINGFASSPEYRLRFGKE